MASPFTEKRLNMVKRRWSGGHPRKKPRLIVDTDNGMPFHCDGCKKPMYFEKVNEKAYRCPKCGHTVNLR